METLKLTDQEQRAYSDLFHVCDTECSGKVTWIKASELFRASGLTPEVQQQITELCGAQRLGHFGRSQFYVALKLIAVAQCGLPLKFEIFNQGTEIPLPKFAHFPEPEVRKTQNQGERNGTMAQPAVGVQIPPPPTKQHVRSLSGTRNITVVPNDNSVQPSQPPMVHTKQNSKDLHIESQEVLKQPSTSPRISSESSSKSDLAWASFEESQEDDQGLLGTGKDVERQWADFQDGAKLDTSSVSSTCSDAESETDIWSITDEQKEYYVNQFRTMQTDLNGVISGAVAKEFFEKSRLPLHELSKIWQLSDMNRDGALSLEEFCTAMHLVVLRRNEIELPDHLPPSLMPYTPLSDEPFASDLPPGSTLKRLTPSSPPPNQQWIMSQLDSQSSSAVSSPGTKPLQFDFKPVTDDGKIAHPVALRMSPDGQPLSVDDKTRTFSDPMAYEAGDDRDFIQEKSPTKQRSYTEVLMETAPEPQPPLAKLSIPLQSRPRPTPKKPQSGNITQIAPPPTGPTVPIVPPRSAKEVVNSKRLLTQKSDPLILSAIDATESIPSPEAGGDVEEANSYHRSLSVDQGHAVHDRLATAQGDSEANKIQDIPESGAANVDRVDSAPDRGQPIPETLLEQPHYLSSLRNAGKDKKDIQAAIRLQKERNTMLSRLNSELNQELQEVMEQRIALEIQLEHLKPFSLGH